MCADCPCTYIEDARNRLVRVAPRDHPDDFLFSRAQRSQKRPGFGKPNQQIARAVDMRINQDLLMIVLLLRTVGRVPAILDLAYNLANQLVDSLALRVATRLVSCTAPPQHTHRS